MIIWSYRLPNGDEGTIRAYSDDDAWNAILAQLGHCPVKLTAICVEDMAAAA
jgi:hypothetical protein